MNGKHERQVIGVVYSCDVTLWVEKLDVVRRTKKTVLASGGSQGSVTIKLHNGRYLPAKRTTYGDSPEDAVSAMVRMIDLEMATFALHRSTAKEELEQLLRRWPETAEEVLEEIKR